MQTTPSPALSAIESEISKHCFFHGLDPKFLPLVAQGATLQTFEPGQVIFTEGSPANRFYLVLEGKVQLEAHQSHRPDRSIMTIGADEPLGWSWLFPPFSWHLQARASDRTRCVVLSGGHLLVSAEEDPIFGYWLMKRVSQLLVRRLQATRKCLLAGTAPEAIGSSSEATR